MYPNKSHQLEQAHYRHSQKYDRKKHIQSLELNNIYPPVDFEHIIFKVKIPANKTSIFV